jgi:hypothetical protein
MLDGTVTLSGSEDQGSVFTVSIAEMGTGRSVDVISGDGNEFIFEDGTKY